VGRLDISGLAWRRVRRDDVLPSTCLQPLIRESQKNAKQQHTIKIKQNMTTIIHTADWQLGKPYGQVGNEEKRSALKRARIDAVAKIGALVAEHNAACLVVAGDLFDSNTPSKATVSEACAAIGEIGVPVYVIPGNHDHGGIGSVWEQEYFINERAALARNLHVLLVGEPVEAGNLVLFPCPLRRVQEVADPTTWLASLDGGNFAGKVCVALVHGSVMGFIGETAGAAVRHIDLDRLPDWLDYIALGDWHGVKKISDKAWYSGAHEPDRFPKGEDYQSGKVLKVELEPGQRPKVEVIDSGLIKWHRHAFEFTGNEGIERLEEQIAGLIGKGVARDALALSVDGLVGLEVAAALNDLESKLDARLICLRMDNRRRIAPTAEESERLAGNQENPVISQVAQALIDQCIRDDDAAEVARMALVELHAHLK